MSCDGARVGNFFFFWALNLFIFAKYPGREGNSSGKWISLWNEVEMALWKTSASAPSAPSLGRKRSPIRSDEKSSMFHQVTAEFISHWRIKCTAKRQQIRNESMENRCTTRWIFQSNHPTQISNFLKILNQNTNTADLKLSVRWKSSTCKCAVAFTLQLSMQIGRPTLLQVCTRRCAMGSARLFFDKWRDESRNQIGHT